ncbi:MULTISPECIES: RelA/SpoT family protein [Methylosinus]|uniref:GTP pyrophosphokinase rsh n=1 Tax=Methylosinus sporium TaxID=428 RepID=A0A2U1SUY2_METSR|nr:MULTISPECIES: bifunctional (p)ppGpp synthetase/guanosine-3',5'-bis(diphosphate) 3'-pyrophosphohydrolase [Methylosinus]MBU3888261.1 bifunctional (p)ppGpp synthetase/guanosine-3',5'-bis(diphosphate) 3'-pyrophosphohydrolase [Methylosinus sp. KRF6]PWB95420.1 bifunctional (p)ppGpp synthetase/guanosine-3',5'-bis(diphosphate) 3'-pyrophosphohydrolase [Methylosinus sporium]TRL37666.1 bifunctional (p)ppGpp synthetase/guanosine-3',5'-bis(diphosphate) 3'-pyrophosphohydrolase [Methylosinus sporium]
MMRQYELVERVRKYNPQVDEDLLNRAYVYAMKAHGQQTRASGDPYFSHPLEVAAILTDLKLDDATIVAAVLHDTVEDTSSTLDEINRLFGPQIGKLVDGLTKIEKLDLVSKKAAQGENFRKLLLAVAEDVRVLLVKLADRLHNMRTLHFVPPEKRARIAQETLDIYAPLAGRMGMQRLREELEGLAFRHLTPEAYQAIESRLHDLRAKNGRIIKKIEKELTQEFATRGIHAAVTGRQKTPYSVWRKMERKSIAFEQLSDIFGFRIIVDDVEDCYRALGIVHTKWPSVPGRFKDYISTPKQNDYRSIHTTVIGPGHQRVELQIRTATMHEIARFGIAAHALYKDSSSDEGKEELAKESRAFKWLQDTLELLAHGDSPEEFLEHTRLELFQDQVFCFTPKGGLIALPRGATPIDFAYAVHTRVGDSAVGAKINGRIAPVLSQLQNGDEVEIIRAESHVPPAAWESLVVTGKARSAIRRATREAVRMQYAGLGRQIVTRAFERAGRPVSDEKLKAALPRLARASLEDAFAAVGRGEIYSGDVVKSVYPDFSEERKPAPQMRLEPGEPGWFGMKSNVNVVFKAPGASDQASAIPIRGLRGDVPVRFAPEGGAVPGDRIVGILTPGEGITIYPIQSPALTAFDDQPDRWLDVRWDIDPENRELFPARLVVTAINEPGTLGGLATLIGETGANIDNVAFAIHSPDFREMRFDLEVADLKHLNDIIARLRASALVSKVERVIG